MIPSKIILHHSLTNDSGTVSWQAIRKYHMDPKGPYKMRDIGYHFGIELVNNEHEILVGRQMTTVGAHTIGQNDVSLGICVIGNYDVNEVPEPAYQKLLKLVDALTTVLHITLDNVKCHRDFAPKTCPGNRFPYQRLLDDLVRRT